MDTLTVRQCDRCSGDRYHDGFHLAARDLPTHLCPQHHQADLARWHIRRAHAHLKALGAPCICSEFHRE